ncbi:bifunctional folylpolyglutamate synthase/dihydrofolate synthase [Arhodomonas sp. AD133]|uniref:bifunctional folylpolyglutamate synthase/dihydrofolate synthase n=1 Tax=Arhodomonas sp. AD133 TaxID=3415009 RepID=UPI003EBE4EB7
MRFTRVDDWLSWLETLHPRRIDPGLERVASVARHMGLDAPDAAVITVAGTNGKGSTVAALTALAGASGHRTGAYTSPHVRRYNERIAIDGEPVSDELLLSAFDAIDQARGGITLSYFEYGTLAALWCFRERDCDMWLLEVGLGGRLDATNVVAPTVAVITSVGVDHTEWLGPDREAIGREKAGILRPGTPLVCADPEPPQSVLDCANELDCPMYRLGQAFDVEPGADGCWNYVSGSRRMPGLPAPGGVPPRLLSNPAAAITAVGLLRDGLPDDAEVVADALGAAVPPARCQRLQRRLPWIVDVAHNCDSATALAERLASEPCAGRTHAVFALMERKDAAGIVTAMRKEVDVWHLIEMDDRGLRAPDELAALLRDAGASVGQIGDTVSLMASLDSAAGATDRIVAFGSFRVAEEVLAAHEHLLPAGL